MERFPFEGTIVAVDGERYRLNLGRPYRVGRGTEFSLVALDGPKADASEAARREIGRLRVNRVEDGGSWAEVDMAPKGTRTVMAGDRVVRRLRPAGEAEDSGASVTLSTKGGLAPDLSALAGVNIYLNGDWAGTTGADGRAEVRIRTGKTYDIVLYRHGYQQVTDRLRLEKGQAGREFVLAVNNAVFKVDSEPSRAAVMVDGDAFGKTPLLDGKPVSLGFHTVKLTVGEDYRDWEEVVEFDKKVEDRTGERRIVLHKDYLRLGERAAQQGNVDAAIQAYGSTEKTHPDYSEAHVRLGQLYLDDKNDFDAAVREFESVLTLPQNKDLIYKQFAVAFTNLGHAYYEKGNRLVDRDREGAAQALAKAVQNLQVAKQNTRFFPTAHHDEALHDTYYYLALAYHKLYLVTRKGSLQGAADLAWREYFDFFPKRLEGNPTFEQSRAGARKYWDQIKDAS